MSHKKNIDDPDVELMRKFQRGDISAFERLIRKYQRPLINFAYRFLHDQNEAEDVAQEIFLRIYSSAKKYRPTARFSTWIYRIATNLCLNELRRMRSRVQDSLETGGQKEESISLPDNSIQGPFEAYTEMERSHVIRKAIDGLPPRQKTAVILCKYQGLSYKEVADIMQCSEGAVKSYLHRARESLLKSCREILEK
jgi:RNA polymerase sigma-70 factor (ECF subfamily)